MDPTTLSLCIALAAVFVPAAIAVIGLLIKICSQLAILNTNIKTIQEDQVDMKERQKKLGRRVMKLELADRQVQVTQATAIG